MNPQFHCPNCGTLNDFNAQACAKCGIDLSQVARPIATQGTPPPQPSAVDTVKLSTVVLIILGIVLIATIVGPIVCGYLAYLSYKSPNKNWPF